MLQYILGYKCRIRFLWILGTFWRDGIDYTVLLRDGRFGYGSVKYHQCNLFIYIKGLLVRLWIVSAIRWQMESSPSCIKTKRRRNACVTSSKAQHEKILFASPLLRPIRNCIIARLSSSTLWFSRLFIDVLISSVGPIPIVFLIVVRLPFTLFFFVLFGDHICTRKWRCRRRMSPFPFFMMHPYWFPHPEEEVRDVEMEEKLAPMDWSTYSLIFISLCRILWRKSDGAKRWWKIREYNFKLFIRFRRLGPSVAAHHSPNLPLFSL